MGIKTFYIGECIGESKRGNLVFKGPENVSYNIFTCQDSKPILENSDHIYEEKKSQDW